MKKIAGVLLLLMPILVQASGGMSLDDADIDLTDNASLMRGAQFYVANCLSCHGAKHIRYSRIAKDLGLEAKVVEETLVPTDQSIHDSMISAMRSEDAEQWFGIRTPDLSVIARSRGADWLYSYLRGFYIDEKRPFGVNNTVFSDVGMPHVLIALQGKQKAVYKEGSDGEIDHLELVKAGTMKPDEYDKAINDLVNFLVYVGEPSQLKRRALGKYVIGFLLIFLVVAYKLKKEYWKEVH